MKSKDNKASPFSSEDFDEEGRKIMDASPSAVLSGNTRNSVYIHGDMDGDGVANIDDSYPYDSDRKKPVADASLSLELKKLKAHSDSHRDVMLAVKMDIGAQKSRLKQPYSIIQKLNKYHLTADSHRRKKDSAMGLTDIAGVMVIEDRQVDVHKTAQYIKKHYNVIKENNYYRYNQEGETPKSGKNDFYHARHFVIKKDGKFVEIQVKTKAQMKLQDKQHRLYKQGLSRPEWMTTEALKLAREGRPRKKRLL